MLREGGPGSGFFGNSGIPGRQGGSLGGRISKFVKDMYSSVKAAYGIGQEHEALNAVTL